MCRIFMSMACERPQRGGSQVHVDACGQKPDFLVDVRNGWPLIDEIIDFPTCSVLITFASEHVQSKLSGQSLVLLN